VRKGENMGYEEKIGTVNFIKEIKGKINLVEGSKIT
jgi:hypothetical protein